MNPRRPRTTPRFLPTHALLAMLSLLPAGCINWADAPRLEKSGNLPGKEAAILLATHPGATLAGGVYTLRMDDSGAGYTVTSRQLLFTDQRGDLHHGTFDKEGTLSTRKAETMDNLPLSLVTKLMDTTEIPMEKATTPVKPWKFTVDAEDVYQFEYTTGETTGFCSTNADGTRVQVYRVETAAP